MTANLRTPLLLVLLTLFAGCANMNSKQQVLAAGSQVEVRSYQTRTYDTDDKVLVMRAVMATLQDLRFVIDKADDTVGVVSATKLDGYALSISVSVRPNGDQMVVRANAQFNLRAIEEPGPYQDFFTALDKGLFLDNNLIQTQVETASESNAAAAKPTPSSATASSAYAFYGEAEAEIEAGEQDSDLWALALVEVEGDEQKRKARYIVLRAEDLYRQNAPTGMQRQPVSAVAVNPSGSATPTATAPAENGLSGLYVDNNGNQVRLQQTGNQITGEYGEHGGTIDGVLKGDTIEYKWEQKLESSGRWINGIGRFRVSDDGRVLSGNWWDPSSSTREGTWTLTRVDTGSNPVAQTRLASSLAAAISCRACPPHACAGFSAVLPPTGNPAGRAPVHQ